LVVARLAIDRWRLRRVEGLSFWRVLGTGKGSDSAFGADLRRSALFAVWRDESDLDRFLLTHPIARRWRRGDEAWHVRLRGLGGHGGWRGVAVTDGLVTGRADGPVVIVTRARVRRRSWRAFAESSRAVNVSLRSADGLLGVVGIGEAPVGRLGTFSLWTSLAAAGRFASLDAAHLEATERARSEGWFAEELFARFEPYGSSGTWDGRDPLAGAQAR